MGGHWTHERPTEQGWYWWRPNERFIARPEWYNPECPSPMLDDKCEWWSTVIAEPPPKG